MPENSTPTPPTVGPYGGGLEEQKEPLSNPSPAEPTKSEFTKRIGRFIKGKKR